MSLCVSVYGNESTEGHQFGPFMSKESRCRALSTETQLRGMSVEGYNGK